MKTVTGVIKRSGNSDFRTSIDSLGDRVCRYIIKPCRVCVPKNKHLEKVPNDRDLTVG